MYRLLGQFGLERSGVSPAVDAAPWGTGRGDGNSGESLGLDLSSLIGCIRANLQPRRQFGAGMFI